MQSTRLKQVLAVLLTLGLIAFIYFNGRNNSSTLNKGTPMNDGHPGQGAATPIGAFDFKLLESDIKSKLPVGAASYINNIEKRVGVGKPSEKDLLLLADKFDSLKQPALAGFYYKKLTEQYPGNEKYLAGCGERFFEAVGQVNDSASMAYFVDLSIQNYEKAVKMNPGDLDSKAHLAVDYIDGKGDVMKGVGMLREVNQADPENKFVLFELGVLSMRSGQWDKAVERFSKLVQVEPENPDNMRYLGQSYQGQGNKDKALEAYQKYKQMVQRPQLKAEADALINSLK